MLENSKEKGIDIYKKANDQKTAQDLAKEEGHNNILELLEAWNRAWNRALTLQKTIEATEANLKANKSEMETLRRKHYFLQKIIEATEAKLKADKTELETLRNKAGNTFQSMTASIS